MYDKILMYDVIDYKKGSYNITDRKFWMDDIKKIIINRTKEKIYLLNWLYNDGKIDIDLYNRSFNIAKYDCIKAYKYIFGLTNID